MLAGLASPTQITGPTERYKKQFRASAVQALKRNAPNMYLINRFMALPRFKRRIGRGPVGADDPAYLINDYIFNRMIRNRWKPVELACVDKIAAKVLAASLCDRVKVPPTRAILDTGQLQDPTELGILLAPFLLSDAFAKPAHSSGGVINLRSPPAPDDYVQLYIRASQNYFVQRRETQYARLQRRVIIEGAVKASTGSLPDDYKFHCIRGRALICQVDHHKLGMTYRRLFDVSSFVPFDVEDGIVFPDDWEPVSSNRYREMVLIANSLSSSFEYVRIDLLDGHDGVYFGEFTLTPGAALGIAPSSAGLSAESRSHRLYSDYIIQHLSFGYAHAA